jgi:hypothetical protein
MLIGLALTAPHHVDAWFSGAVWDDNLAHMSAANGAYWLTFGSFGVPQTVIGLMVLWLDRRGIVPPSFIAWTLAANAVICGMIFDPFSPWPVDVLSAALLLAGARAARRGTPHRRCRSRYERHRKATQLGNGCDGQAGWKTAHASRRACRASPAPVNSTSASVGQSVNVMVARVGNTGMPPVVAAIPQFCLPCKALLVPCRPSCPDYQDGPSAGRVPLDADVGEADFPALRHEGRGLLVGPAMASEPGGAGTHLAFDREQSPSWDEYSSGLGEPGSDVLPVVDGGQ